MSSGFPVFAVALETNQYRSVIGKARYDKQAFDNYNNGVLSIPGHVPLTITPASVFNVESPQVAAASMQERFKRVRVHIDEKGCVSAHVPSLEASSITITDPELKEKFQQLYAKLGPVRVGAPSGHAGHRW